MNPKFLSRILPAVLFYLLMSQGLLSAASNPLSIWTKRNPTIEDGKLLSAAGGDGKYVAAGLGGTILFSTDLVTWVPSQTVVTGDVNRVVYGGGKFVALNSKRSLWTSSDGLNWQKTLDYPGLNPTISDIAFGNGVFCALTRTNSTVLSVNGTSWSAGASGITGSGFSLSFVNGAFVIPSATPQQSTDGVNWTTVPNSSLSVYDRLYYENDRYFKIRSEPFFVSKSPTLESPTWTSQLNTSSAGYNGIAFGNGKYVVSAFRPAYFTSDDGANWNTPDTLQFDEEIFEGTGIAFLNGLFVLLGDNGAIATSEDGTEWTLRTRRAVSPAFNSDISSVDYFRDRFIGFTYYGWLVSRDGIEWKHTFHFFWGPRYSVCHSDERLVAVGYGAVVATTTNLIDWTVGGPLTGDDLNGVVFANGKFFAVGARGTIYSSVDGTTWTLHSSGVTSTLNGITYGNGQFVAVGANSTILTSPNGTNWTKRTISESTTLKSVAAGNNRFLIVGTARRLVSYDGINWTIGYLNTHAYCSVIFAKDRFVLNVGNDIYTTTDGNILSYPSTVSDSVIKLVYGRDSVVGVGLNGGIFQSDDSLVTQPRLTSAYEPEARKLLLSVSAEPQRALTIQESTDLLTWSNLSALTNSSSSVSITNEIGTGELRRFFRVFYP